MRHFFTTKRRKGVSNFITGFHSTLKATDKIEVDWQVFMDERERGKKEREERKREEKRREPKQFTIILCHYFNLTVCIALE